MKKFRKLILASIIGILMVLVFSGVLIDSYKYFKDTSTLNSIVRIDQANSQHNLSLFTYLKTKRYISSIHFTRDTDSVYHSKISHIIENARIGESLGFLTENIKTQEELIDSFPGGLLNINELINALKTRKIIAPYGEYNNNYLTKNNNKLIYSDDSDMAGLTHNVLQKMTTSEIRSPQLFSDKLAKAMAQHWLEMKNSGEYGNDGLYYGKRGYSKEMLQVLSILAMREKTQRDWFVVNDKLVNNNDNGSLLRAWPIGMDMRISSKHAYNLAVSQSNITHANKDIAISAGALAFMIHEIMEDQFTTRKQVIASMLSTIENAADKNSSAASHIKQGVLLAEKNVDPILVYNKISGMNYADLLLLITYTFLHFDNYSDALIYIVHTPGDNDSVAFVIGALFTAYSMQSLPSNYIKNIEPMEWKDIII